MNVAAFNRRQRAHNRRVIRLVKAFLARLRREGKGLRYQRGNAEVRALVALVVLGFALLVWAWPDVRAWIGAAQTATTCRIPEEHEQLHIVVVRRGRQLVTDCMYVVSRGQAQRAAREGTRP